MVERVTDMHVTLLPQVVHHYPRDLTGQADTLFQDVERFADPQGAGRWASTASIRLIEHNGRAVHAAREHPRLLVCSDPLVGDAF